MTSQNRIYVEKTITAQNQFTDPIRLVGNFMLIVEDTSSMSMTVVVQRRTDASATWRDVTKDDAGAVKTITGAGQFIGFEASNAGAEYRAGVKTGGYTSGQSLVRLEQ